MQLIYNTLYGSRAYGLNELESDYDLRMVYVPTKRDKLLISNPELIHVSKYGVNLPISNIEIKELSILKLNIFDDKEQLKNNGNNLILDYKQYELNRFKEGLYSGNVECIEMLYCFDLNINYVHEIFKPLIENRQEFITKRVIERYLSTSLSAIKEINKSLENDFNIKSIGKNLKHMYRCYLNAVNIIKTENIEIGTNTEFIFNNISRVLNLDTDELDNIDCIIKNLDEELEQFLDLIKFSTDMIKHSKIKEVVNKDKIDDIILSLFMKNVVYN